MQVDPMRPTLKAPGSKRLKPEHEKLLSNFALNVNLRCYREAQSRNKHFMDEIEFFVTDVMATIALNGFVLTMLSPAATLGRTPGGGRGSHSSTSQLSLRRFCH